MASSKATIRQEKGSSNTKGRLRKVHRVLKRKKPLSELSVDEVMDGDAEVSDDDERGNEDTDVQAPTAGKKKAPRSHKSVEREGGREGGKECLCESEYVCVRERGRGRR